jgi:hypothetical protein
MKGVQDSDRVGQLTTRSQARDPSTALRAAFGHPQFEVELEIGTVPVAGGRPLRIGRFLLLRDLDGLELAA